jgi:hypothetical protein
MSTEQKDLDQNALAARLNRFWGDFKRGRVVSYKLMGFLLLVVGIAGATWYIVHERRKAASTLWLSLEEATTDTALQVIIDNNPNTVQGRIARLELARNDLGEAGIEQLNSPSTEARKKAVENIERARESFGKLVEEFKDQPILKAECLLGLAKAEAMLIAVPTKEGQLSEFKGTIPKIIERLDELVAIAPDTPWAAEAKKLAETLRDPAKRDAFVTIQQTLYKAPTSDLFKGGDMPLFPGGLPGMPGMPGMPGVPPTPGSAPKLPILPGSK